MPAGDRDAWILLVKAHGLIVYVEEDRAEGLSLNVAFRMPARRVGLAFVRGKHGKKYAGIGYLVR